MAEITTPLGASQRLQIIVVPAAVNDNYTSPSTAADRVGKLIFRELTNTIEVNGHEYHADNGQFANLGAALTALVNTGYLRETSENSGVYEAVTPAIGTVSSLLGDLISSTTQTDEHDNITSQSVSAWITALQTDIQNLKTLTATGTSSTFVVRDKTTAYGQTGATDFETTAQIHTAIAGAKQDAIDTVVGTGATGEHPTWGENEAQTLSHLKDLINTLGGGSEVSLSDIQDQIDQILNEMSGVGSEDLNTVLDAYRTLRGYTNGTAPALTVEGATGTITTIQDVIDALEDLIDNSKTVVSGATGDTYISVTDTTVQGATATTYTVQSTTGLSNAIGNAKTTVTAATGTASSNAYVTVTKTPGVLANGTGDSYAIQSTKALDDAISNAKSTATGTGSYITVSVATGTGSTGDAYTIGTTAALDTALAKADNVVSWTVIGAND